MNFAFTKYFKYIFFLILMLFCLAFKTDASIIVGTISPTSNTAQVCETPSCTVSATSPVNFGYFTTATSANVIVTDTELTGYIWGKSFGWAVLNCANTTSGCSSTNGNFKVANNFNGTLSGYAWGDNSGWINFGPFGNSPTSQITINGSGQFNGYAWSQNYGWIKFNCSDPNYCVATDWRPRNTRPECSDGIDNDGDGLIDSADPGCHTDGNASNSGSYDPTDNTEFTSSAGPISPPAPPAPPGPITPPVTPPETPPVTPPETPPVTPPVTPPETVPPPVTPPETPPVTPPETPPATPPETPPVTPPSISDIAGTITNTISNGASVVGSLVSSVLGGINDNAKVAKVIATKAAKKTSEVLNTPAGDVTAKTVVTLGAVSGVSFSLATALFANPLSFSEIFLIPLRLWGLLMTALGFKKRNRPWGTVYDSVTKQPLDPAYVVLEDLNGNEVATSITDLDGRYGFLVAPGQYKMIANKTNYNFPSKNMAGKANDEIYQDLYSNEVIDLVAGGVITKNIPMDPINFDWNEFAKKEQSLMKFYSKKDVWLARVSNILFIFGFSVTAIAMLAAPKTYNIATFAVYVALFVLKHTVLKPRPFGNVKYKGTDRPLSFAVMRIFSVGAEHEITHKITDKNGKYYCLVPNGLYYVKIENKNPDASYSLIYTSENIEVKGGYINKMFEV
ncbi:MAG TPA: carboxypeptidase-like regulatory domain-containing protein [Candidatus Paceibacterota bacterium]|nr:carboxypeptidase-like regulatory domain-containing protein [Candidatus Paceibacterota bacterium]